MTECSEGGKQGDSPLCELGGAVLKSQGFRPSNSFEQVL